jgi:hypothetical protein
VKELNGPLIWEPTRLPFVRACPQKVRGGTHTLWALDLLGGVSKQQVAPIPAEGHLSALNDAAGEADKKMVHNIRTRDFVFRL